MCLFNTIIKTEQIEDLDDTPYEKYIDMALEELDESPVENNLSHSISDSKTQMANIPQVEPTFVNTEPSFVKIIKVTSEARNLVMICQNQIQQETIVNRLKAGVLNTMIAVRPKKSYNRKQASGSRSKPRFRIENANPSPKNVKKVLDESKVTTIIPFPELEVHNSYTPLQVSEYKYICQKRQPIGPSPKRRSLIGNPDSTPKNVVKVLDESQVTTKAPFPELEAHNRDTPPQVASGSSPKPRFLIGNADASPKNVVKVLDESQVTTKAPSRALGAHNRDTPPQVASGSSPKPRFLIGNADASPKNVVKVLDESQVTTKAPSRALGAHNRDTPPQVSSGSSPKPLFLIANAGPTPTNVEKVLDESQVTTKAPSPELEAHKRDTPPQVAEYKNICHTRVAIGLSPKPRFLFDNAGPTSKNVEKVLDESQVTTRASSPELETHNKDTPPQVAEYKNICHKKKQASGSSPKPRFLNDNADPTPKRVEKVLGESLVNTEAPKALPSSELEAHNRDTPLHIAGYNYILPKTKQTSGPSPKPRFLIDDADPTPKRIEKVLDESQVNTKDPEALPSPELEAHNKDTPLQVASGSSPKPRFLIENVDSTPKRVEKVFQFVVKPPPKRKRQREESELELEKFINLNEVTKPLICKHCSKAFLTHLEFGFHSRVHNENRLYSCHLCEYQKDNKKTFEVHVKGHDLYKCEKCNRILKSRLCAYKHSKSHSVQNTVQCEICGKHLKKQCLSIHKKILHSDDRANQITKCPICEKEYQNPNSLRQHYSAFHRELGIDVSVVCDICGMRLSCKGKLSQHLRTHTGDKPFACELCPKRFIAKDNLAAHMRIHTGEKPYECKYCGKKFAYGAPYRYHIKTHTGEKRHACHLCNKGFISKAHMKIHLKSCNMPLR